ncbi:hypothetical protein ES703_104855 [subsurface metagenome]
MGYKKPGVRDGTGPAKDSYQRKIRKIGKRKVAGEVCPVKIKKKAKL